MTNFVNKPHCPSPPTATQRIDPLKYIRHLLQQLICYFQSEWCVDDAKAQQSVSLPKYSPYIKNNVNLGVLWYQWTAYNSWGFLEEKVFKKKREGTCKGPIKVFIPSEANAYDDGAKLEYLKKEKIIKNNMCLFFFV